VGWSDLKLLMNLTGLIEQMRYKMKTSVKKYQLKNYFVA